VKNAIDRAGPRPPATRVPPSALSTEDLKPPTGTSSPKRSWVAICSQYPPGASRILGVRWPETACRAGPTGWLARPLGWCSTTRSAVSRWWMRPAGLSADAVDVHRNPVADPPTAGASRAGV